MDPYLKSRHSVVFVRALLKRGDSSTCCNPLAPRTVNLLCGGPKEVGSKMTIKFAKHANRPSTMSCVRDDGSATWFTASAANADYSVSHDLLHYAVEAVLGYTTAFYGLVAAGRDLNDFGSTDGVTDDRSYSREAIDAERLVGLIQSLTAGGSSPEFGALADVWENSAKTEDDRVVPVTEAQLAEICLVWGRLVHHWQTIPVGGAMELSFPKPAVLTNA
jgi:hypothetical protein